MQARPIDPGLLTKRVRIETVTESGGDSGSGEVTETWSLLGNRWAWIEPLNGRELELARQIHEEVSYKIVIRYWSQVTSLNRVVFNGRVFEIKAVLNPSEGNEQMQLFCAETT